jgi:uncharacterized repeat protein (TIGR04042 family)
MPEIHFSIEWPDGVCMRCYSPSTVVRNYFSAGEVMTIDQLVTKATDALRHAGDRVEAKFGYRCTSAQAQLEDILERAETFGSDEELRIVTVE